MPSAGPYTATREATTEPMAAPVAETALRGFDSLEFSIDTADTFSNLHAYFHELQIHVLRIACGIQIEEFTSQEVAKGCV